MMLPPETPASFEFAVNRHGRDKDWDYEVLTSRFENTRGSLQDLIEAISQGYAITAATFKAGSRRAKSNVLGTHLWLLDIDNSDVLRDETGLPVKDADGKAIKVYKPQLTIEEAKNHPFIQKHCLLCYTSASHKPDWHKFRLVLRLPYFVAGVDVIETIARRLMEDLPGDPACKDASRVFFGNTNAIFFIANPDAEPLPEQWIVEASVVVQQQKVEQERRYQQRLNRLRSQDRNEQDIDSLVQNALSYIPPRSPGSGNYEECRTVLMALHSYYGLGAEAIAERWSPSIKGTTWNVGRKLRSFKTSKSKEVTLGSLFYIAQRYGFKFPSKTQDNFSESSKRDRTISADEWVWQHGLPNWFRNQLAKLPQVFKGFGKRSPRNRTANLKQPLLPKIITYVPGDRVPSREQYEQMGCPTIRFAREHRLQLYAELVAAGWQHILDSSGTGSGKSHDVGLAHPGQFDATKLLLYFAEDHRNPTVATIEANYTDLPVRHDGEKKGLLSDSSRQTALGNPHQRWAKNGEKPTITGNCPHTELFHVFKNKGYNEAALTAELNPICSKHCVHGWSCGNKSKALPGSDYRTVRSEVLKQSSHIRLNLESTPDDIGKEAGAFWEEASRLIKPIQAIEARLADFDQVFADIETEAPDVYDQLTPLRRGARPLLAGKVKPTQETYHGWNDVTLRQLFGAPPENLEKLIATLETVQPDLEEILSIDRVLVAENTDVDSSAVKRLNRLVRRESYRDSKQQLESLPTNWLLPLLRIWGGLQPGAMRIGGGVLTITTRNSRPAEIAQGLKFNIYLDATANREFLARYLDIALADIIQLQQEPERFDNLKIVQITGFGLAGRNRSDSLKQRCSALKAELRARHADIAFIEHQSHAEKETGDGWWFNHNRGSNEYQSRSALASIGSPYQNIGHLQDVYITLTGDRNVGRDAPGFSSFVLWLTQSEFVQLANRLRANRRSEQELPCYIATEIDLGFLQEYYPGSTIEQVDTFDISRSAGSATQQSHWKIQQAVLAAVEQTGKAIEDLTQVEAAKLAKVTQGRIAQVASKYGGWRAFLKLLAALLKGINTTTNNSPENNPNLDEDQQFLAQTYLPLVAVEDPPDVVQALLITVQSYGWRVFEAILSAMDSETKGRLLAAMLAGLPNVLRKEFRAAVAAAGG